MLSLPALVLCLIGGDTESEALLAEENVSAVTGVYGVDGVVLRELNDVSLLFVDVALCMCAAYPVVGITESLEYLCADSGHDGHVGYDVD